MSLNNHGENEVIEEEVETEEEVIDDFGMSDQKLNED